jgi:hypothetical protein
MGLTYLTKPSILPAVGLAAVLLARLDVVAGAQNRGRNGRSLVA